MNEASTLRTLNAFAVDLITIPSVEDLFWYVAQNVVGRLNFIDCVIYEMDAADNSLLQVAALGEKNPYDRSILNPLRIPVGHGITGHVAQTGEAIVVDDLLKDQNYIPDTQPARSEICVPMLIQGRVVGVIDSEHPDPNAFGDAEREILMTVAAMTSAKLELLAEADRSNQRYQGLVASHAELSQETSNRKALEAKLFSARKLEAVGRLTGKFAHDFNNILTVISGNLEFLAEEITSPSAQEFMADAQNSAALGGKLIRDMLSFSQRASLKKEIVDPNDITQSVLDAQLPNVPEQIEVRLNLQKSGTKILVDIKEAKAAVLNLILNAQDAMSDGGILGVNTTLVNHTLANNHRLATPLLPGKYCCISVQDTGDGIPAEHAQQIFDPFFTSKEVGKGAGLGLSMVLGFLQQSGGTVAVQSLPNQGAVFQLYFPVVDPD